MTTTRTASVGTSNVTHTATAGADGQYGIACGAVRYRSTKRGSLRLHPDGTDVTCTRCVKAAAPVAPVLPLYYGKPINTPTGHRWAGYAAA